MAKKKSKKKKKEFKLGYDECTTSGCIKMAKYPNKMCRLCQEKLNEHGKRARGGHDPRSIRKNLSI